jgi:hypothetical protein
LLRAEILERLGRSEDAAHARAEATRRADRWLEAVAARSPRLGEILGGERDPNVRRPRLWPKRARRR